MTISRYASLTKNYPIKELIKEAIRIAECAKEFNDYQRYEDAKRIALKYFPYRHSETVIPVMQKESTL